MIPFSILDLSPINQGSDAAQAFRNSLDLAQHAERWGYKRFWLAEHHNMPGIASAATAVAIGYVAGGTRTIRVGSGGVMLPNHAPLVIAEQFGTLHSLYPGRIDLGLGRAPGTDQRTARALRRDLVDAAETRSRSDVLELQALLRPVQPGQAVRAVPGRRLTRPALAARIEPLQRAACGRARLAVRVRVAFRAGRPDAGVRASIARSSGRPSSSRGPMPWSASTCSQRKPRVRRAVSSRRCSSSSSACGVARPDRCRPRSTAWTASGRRWSGRASSRRWRIPWSAHLTSFKRD